MRMLWAALWLFSMVCACGDDTAAPPPPLTGDGDGDGDSGDGDGDGDDEDPPPENHDAGVQRDADMGGVDAATEPTDCGDVSCGLNGDCVVSATTGAPTCVCDHGYVREDDAPDGVCVEDKRCVELDVVECRQSSDEGSAVAMVVSATFCSGNPVLSLTAGDLELEELGTEDKWEVPGVESSLKVLQREHVPHVYLLIDMSASVVTSGVLPQVRAGISEMLDKLGDASAAPRVAVFLFDGSSRLYEFQPETTDLMQVRTRLQDLEAFTVQDPGSTDLFGATVKGINRLEGAIDTKYFVHEAGLLATKTLVIVSDGDDDAGRYPPDFVQKRIDSTPAQVITIGLGDETLIEELTSLGRDGSYAAPTEARVLQAFAEVGQRVVDYPKSLYLVGYCSPKRCVQATCGASAARVRHRSIEDVVSQVCAFDYSQFGSCTGDPFDPEAACTADGRECGGILGCGTCAAGEACFGGTCVAASAIPAGERCGQHWMCEAGNDCTGGDEAPKTGQCGALPGVDDACDDDSPCGRPGAWCDLDAGMCVATLALGQVCEGHGECASGLCERAPGASASAPTLCQPPARMYDSCNGRPCEPGSFCASCTGDNPACSSSGGSVCMPLRYAGQTCSQNAMCQSGGCVNQVCTAPAYRFLSVPP